MARTRQIYQTDLLYVGPTGANPATGKHFGETAITYNGTTSIQRTGATNWIAELYRVQRADYSWSKTLTDVNQFGELAAIDRVSLEQPTVNLSFNYLLSNFINEQLLGFNVATNGQAMTSAISGFLDGTQDTKNYFIKIANDGQDAIDNAGWYDVIAIGNGFLSSYTSQGAVGGFPSVDVTVEGLNIQCDKFDNSFAITGTTIPAVFPTDGTPVNGWYYNLPTGVTSYNNTTLSDNKGISVLRPGDITLDLGLSDGDILFNKNDLKVQSYNLSFNLTRENINKLGSKYAYAKAIQFPVTVSLQVSAIVGDNATGKLTNIINANKDFDPSITIKKPGNPSTIICYYKLKNAKMDSNEISSSIGANKTLNITFTAQLGGPQDTTKGLFMSGITINSN